MIRYTSTKQLSIFDFKTPFETTLSPDNRWVKLSDIIPWEVFSESYLKGMSSNLGRPGLSPRMVLGALIIKHKENLSDQRTIEAIQENIYMQFFVGLESFQTDPIFDSSLFVTLRKRIGKSTFSKLNNALIKMLSEKVDQRNISKKDADSDTPPNRGNLQADATVADQNITYPTDAKLLNTSRKKLEIIIDKLYEYGCKEEVKPRTYRKCLDRDFLNYSKKKRKGIKTHRKLNRKLLCSVKRNLNHIEKMLSNVAELVLGKDYPLTKQDLEYLKTIKLVYQQQKEMYDTSSNTCKNRIVSISQPWVRPILRGKQNARVEFGSKLGVSLDNGFAYLETLSWEAYHEGTDLKKHVERYYEIHGYFPELVQVDKAYHTRDNRKWLKERNIRITAKPLGRKPKIETNPYQKAKRKKEQAERNHIEGKFGEGKNRYNLNEIRAKLKETSVSWISCIFFIMNLENYLKKASLGSKFKTLMNQIRLVLVVQILLTNLEHFVTHFYRYYSSQKLNCENI
jgi:hypothetical protein